MTPFLEDNVSDAFWLFFSVSHVTCFSDLSHSSNLPTSASHKKPDSGAAKVSVRLVWARGLGLRLGLFHERNCES